MDTKLVSEKFGLSDNYFHTIEKTSLPIYFGIIGNHDISKVKVIEKKRNIDGDISPYYAEQNPSKVIKLI